MPRLVRGCSPFCDEFQAIRIFPGLYQASFTFADLSGISLLAPDLSGLFQDAHVVPVQSALLQDVPCVPAFPSLFWENPNCSGLSRAIPDHSWLTCLFRVISGCPDCSRMFRVPPKLSTLFQMFWTVPDRSALSLLFRDVMNVQNLPGCYALPRVVQ